MYTPIAERMTPTYAHQRVYRFANDYGASVVRGLLTVGGAEGLFEVAVIRFNGANDWTLTYTTPITDDVIGRLTEDEVTEVLAKIEALPQPPRIAE